MGSELGVLFRIATWGESHGGAVGVVVDGCPPRLPLSEADIQPQLDRRRPGQSLLTSPRNEADQVRILSGVFEGRTLGTPILLLMENTDARPGAYERLREIYRPSHADYTYDAKFGIRQWQGGGRASARETAGRVAAGAIAEKILRLAEGIEIVAWVRRVADIEARIGPAETAGPVHPRETAAGAAGPGRSGETAAGAPGPAETTAGAGVPGGVGGAPSWSDPMLLTRSDVDATPVRCPDPEAASRMIGAIEAARRDGDSLGGVIEAIVRNVPPGLGEPVFDRLEADLAKAMLSLPACKGFEVGSGFAGARMRGSSHNDAFIQRPGGIGTRTNRSGGIQGGISNGEPIIFRAAFKPTATIRKPQDTVDVRGNPVVLEAQGRHDPCVLPRAVPIVEAMAALVLVDHWLRQTALSAGADRIERGSARNSPDSSPER